MSQQIVYLFVFIILKTLYLPLNRRESRYYWNLPLDSHMPLISFFVIPYVFYFVYIPIIIVLTWMTPSSLLLLKSLAFGHLCTVIFWYFFPNGVKRPTIVAHTYFDQLLLKVYRHDNDTNGFPSSHVLTTLICAYYYASSGAPVAWLSWVVAISIVMSTVFTKQHYIIDVIGGIIVALVSTLVVL